MTDQPFRPSLHSMQSFFHGHESTGPPWPAHLSTGPVGDPTTAESDSDSEGTSL
jgi:hypothetical protein